MPDFLITPLIETALKTAAISAGKVILEIQKGNMGLENKSDGSPVTIADQQAEVILLEALNEHLPQIPVVAEEQAAAGNTPNFTPDGFFFLVDPLDGTKEFIKGGNDFTVNIGLIHNYEPIWGLIYIPATDTLYIGQKDSGAKRISSIMSSNPIEENIFVMRPAPSPLRIVASKSHLNNKTEDFLSTYPGAAIVNVGSSLKFCRVAEGEADIYPRFGPTMEWDTAAGDAIVRSAGGKTTNPDDTPFKYGKAEFRNGFFISKAK
jgi:3'(2'),5'-bisphosphate nucleotidase